ncbi:DUF58 domain-containing protein [Methylocella sp.]|uniref:DUF58 domain-containing protein n=1 Tax=Methylocella sp. TaxID=1978226 RepID=UPI003783626E
MRHLDRNVTARAGAPHVRAFREERERAVLLVADLRPSMLFARGARCVLAGAEALALVGWRAAREGRVGLVALTFQGAELLRYGRGAGHDRGLRRARRGPCRGARRGARADPPLDAALEEADAVAGRSELRARDRPRRGRARFAAVAEKIAARRDLAVLLMTDRFETARRPAPIPS